MLGHLLLLYCLKIKYKIEYIHELSAELSKASEQSLCRLFAGLNENEGAGGGGVAQDVSLQNSKRRYEMNE